MEIHHNGIAGIRETVNDLVRSTPVIDIHTHLFTPEFGEMNLFGIDHLLTYHYLIAEMFRCADVKPDTFWSMDVKQQADLVWRTLFVDRLPVSEAARGAITVLNSFGLDPAAASLDEAREFFASRPLDAHIGDVLEKANVDTVVMTNDLFDPAEIALWQREPPSDTRFKASLRMDLMLNSWPDAARFLAGAGRAVDADLGGSSVAEVRRYLDEWIGRMEPLYLAVSLPDDFQFPADDVRNRLLNEVVLATARDTGIPFAMMIGVRRGVNPALRAAGDGVGRADVSSVERLCAANPDVRFLTTFLSRENQHELCVAARKFSNLMPFGCWWFLNNPSIIAEITTERMELLGTSFIPQHSDARVLEQLIYKWKHSREVIADCLSASYEQLAAAGRPVSREEIERDVRRLFAGNFENWTAAV